MVGECARSRSRGLTIKSLAFLLKAQFSAWHHSSAPAHLLFLRKDEILVRIAAKQFHSATTCFLFTSQSHACQPALQLQEWDLQDITIRKRGGEAPSVPVGRSIRMAATTPSPSLSRTGKISYLCDFLGIRRKYEIIHQTFAIFSKFFVILFRDC